MSRHVLHRDIETRSTIDLADVGAWRYAGKPTTGVWCVAFAIDDAPTNLWIPGQPIPGEFHAATRDPEWLVVAHNDAFERAIEERILAPQYGWPLVPIERHRCTMAMASASALPAALKTLAPVLELPIQKDAAGARLMRQMARPRAPRADEDPNGLYWHDEPEKLEGLYAYCRRDVDVERAAYHRLPELIDSERALWALDATINRRGFYTDGLLESASRIAAAAGEAVQEELREITAGALTSTDQVTALLAWLAERGCEVKNVQKTTLKHALRRKELDPVVRRVIELRLGAAHAAAAKIDSLLAWRDGDGRVRGTLRFHGAGTGRWTGHGPQPQNFKRDTDGTEAKLAAIATGDLAQVVKLYPQPLEIIGDIARAMICAAPEHRLLIGDFSGIESRVLAWVSGQQSKLDQWAKFDRTADPKDEPYYLLGRSCGQPEESARAVGKTADLAFGYMGGVGAWDRLAPEDDTSTKETKQRYQKTWRSLHPQTVNFWAGINRAIIYAVRKPGTVFTCRHLSVVYDGEMFLRITLPSGRSLLYPSPRLETDKFGNAMVVFKDSAGGKWVDCRFGQGAYGGLWTENIVQAIARDLLAAAMQRLEAGGYPVTLHVHDEVVCEAPIGVGSVEEFQRLITTLPDWAEGLPIAAKVRNGARFAKSEQTNGSTGTSGNTYTNGDYTNDNTDSYNTGSNHNHDDDHRDTDSRGHGEEEYGHNVTEFTYLDQFGRPYLIVAKYVAANGKKNFPQYHIENEKRVKGPPPGPRIPYRLPQLIKASPDTPVCFTEGEKDADTLVKYGFIATTNPEGAGKFQAELVPWFAGRETIYLFEDNDHAGRLHIAHAAARLAGVVKNIFVVRFPDVPEKEDVTYWLDTLGHTKADLLERIQAAPKASIAGILESVRASDVKMEAIDWLWPGRFALGKLGILAGLPDEGKSTLLCYIAGRLTNTDLEWPNGEGRPPRRGSVILLTSEDAPSDTLVPRLAAAGADLNKIEIVQMVHDRDLKDGRERKRMFSMADDLGLLRQKIEELGDVIAIEIDPVTAYLGSGKKGIDSFRDTDVRAVLGPLIQLANEYRLAIIAIMHFNKKTDVTNALLRISNSLAFGGVARHVFSITKDADNARRLMARAKNNIASEANNQTLAFHFETKQVGKDWRDERPIEAPFIVFEPGYVDVTATEALSAASENKAPGAVDDAKDFLHAMLVAGGGRAPKAEIEEAAEAEKISGITLRRAKTKLKIQAEKDRSTPDGKWYWVLPDGDTTI